jgi:hypothetical protein
LPIVALAIVGFLGAAGFAVDLGRAYVVRTQIQTAVNAGALAASGAAYYTTSTFSSVSCSTNPSSTTIQGIACMYAGNTYNKMYGGTISATVTGVCLNSLLPSTTPCSSSAINNAVNAVKVSAQANVKTTFMALFGVKTLAAGATATATMGTPGQPWNIAIIIDATDSMVSNKDSNCGGVTRLQCALNSVQTLLGVLPPCPLGVSSCTPAKANARVTLFQFPNAIAGTTTTVSNKSVTVNSIAQDYGCNATIPTPAPYTLPPATTTSSKISGYTPFAYTSGSGSTAASWTATYQIISSSTTNADANGFLSDYYTSPNVLNTSSAIVKAIGGLSGCKSMNTAGGAGTYYAGVIYAAQEALTAEQALDKTNGITANNAIIILSDGEATATTSGGDFAWSPLNSDTSKSSIVIPGTASLSGAFSADSGTGYYPSATDECQQAIIAAQNAVALGTRVYAVAYGSESSGCTDSSTLTLPSTANQSFTYKTLTPCITMEDIASSMSYFYADANQSGTTSTCIDNSHPVNSLNAIGLAIGGSFTSPRLVPNSAQ